MMKIFLLFLCFLRPEICQGMLPESPESTGRQLDIPDVMELKRLQQIKEAAQKGRELKEQERAKKQREAEELAKKQEEERLAYDKKREESWQQAQKQENIKALEQLEIQSLPENLQIEKQALEQGKSIERILGMTHAAINKNPSNFIGRLKNSMGDANINGDQLRQAFDVLKQKITEGVLDNYFDMKKMLEESSTKKVGSNKKIQELESMYRDKFSELLNLAKVLEERRNQIKNTIGTLNELLLKPEQDPIKFNDNITQIFELISQDIKRHISYDYALRIFKRIFQFPKDIYTTTYLSKVKGTEYFGKSIKRGEEIDLPVLDIADKDIGRQEAVNTLKMMLNQVVLWDQRLPDYRNNDVVRNSPESIDNLKDFVRNNTDPNLVKPVYDVLRILGKYDSDLKQDVESGALAKHVKMIGAK